MKLPNVKSPCKDCPFRKDTKKGWLGEMRITEILNQDSFVCHKTVDYLKSIPKEKERLQCAGHMILKGNDNAFVRLAQGMGLDLELKGHELVFDNDKECINHHKN